MCMNFVQAIDFKWHKFITLIVIAAKRRVKVDNVFGGRPIVTGLKRLKKRSGEFARRSGSAGQISLIRSN